MLLRVLPLFIVCFILVFYYVYQDIKYREINIIPIIVVCLLSVVYLYLFVFRNNCFLWTQYFSQIIITIIFLTIIYVFGKMTSFAYIGEGDLLVVLLISFTSGFLYAFSQLVFLLALFIMLIIPLSFFIYNLIKKQKPEHGFLKNTIMMFLGTKMPLEKITDFYTPLEILKYKNKKLVKEVQLEPNCSPKAQLRYIKSLARKNNISELWASPLIPFIVALFVSYVIVALFLFFGILANYGIVSFL